MPTDMWRSLGVLTGCHTMTKGGHHNMAGTVARCDETHGLCCPHHLYWIMGLRVMAVQCQLPLGCVIMFWQIRELQACTQYNQCCKEPGGHMKINLPVFKDEDKKDAITYQSWHWDLMMYYHAGCQDCTLLPYIICSLQDIPESW